MDVIDRQRDQDALLGGNEQLATELEAMNRLHELGGRLLRSTDLVEALSQILDACMWLVDADFGNVQLYDQERRSLRITVQRGFQREFLESFSEVSVDDDAACARAMKTRERVIIEDIEADRDHGYARLRPIAAAAGFRAVQSTPLLSQGGELVGMLSTHFRRAHKPSERELRLLDLYTRHAVEMILRFQAEQSLRQQYTQLQTLYRLSDAVSRATGADEMCRLAIEGLLQAIPANRAAVLLFDSDGVMRFKAWRGLSDAYRAAVEGHTPWKPGQRNAEPLTIDDVDVCSEPSLCALRPIIVREGIGAMAFIPLVDQDGVLGKFMVYYDAPHHFSGEELSLCRAIAGSVAFSINRARSEQALREGEERFRTLADNMAQLAWMADEHGSIFWYNKRWFEYTGTTLEQVQGWGWTRVHHPDHVDRVVQRLQRSWDTGEPWEDLFPLRDRNGEYRWFLSRALPIRDDGGKIVRWFGTNTDVTDRLQAEQQLREARDTAEQANAAKDKFLAALSHELRTPLTPVLMTAQALETDRQLPEGTRSQLRTLRQHVELEARLIDDLLDLTRIVRGKLQLHPEAVDAHALLRHAVETCHDGDIAPKHLEVVYELSALRTIVWGDAARLEQVFWNLIKNAAKFTPPGGRITLRSRNDPDGVLRFEIQDSGVGIAPEMMPHLFRAFEQGGNEVTRRFGGLGLGLAISRAVLDMHGGSISASSGGRDRGSTFAISLATLSPEDARVRALQVEAGAEGADAQSQATLRILLVEDHQSTAEVLARLLRSLHHEVDVAHTVEEATALASENRYALVISDLGLPDGSGHELMRDLRSNQGLRGIALSGYGMEEDVQASREAGFDTHLVKPVNFKSLELAISRVMTSAER